MSTKPEFGPFVRKTLIARHGSLAFAAERLGISYERLKKAIQRNRFSASDIEIMLPERSYEDWAKDYHFSFSRRHGSSEAPAPDADTFDLFEKIEAGFHAYQRGVRDTDFSEFVRDLYRKIGSDGYSIQSMVLFCHVTSQPVEWSPQHDDLLNQLSHAIDKGATIIYVMECDLVKDNIDSQFEKHLRRLKSLCASDSETEKGFIALIRVARCAFCIPYQKPALFSKYGDNDVIAKHYALTTVNLPERIDGEIFLGTAVLPLENVVAHAMRDYLFELVDKIENISEISPLDFHFTCLPEGNKSELISKLKPLVDL